MRHQGGGKCLLSECAPGYRCDCLGFETCSITKCSKFTTLSDVIPSDKQPFSCHLMPNFGTCVTVSGIRDIASAAVSAKSESSELIGMMGELYVQALTDLMEMQSNKKVMDNSLKSLHDNPNATFHDVQHFVVQVVGHIVDAHKEVQVIHDAMVQASQADLQVYKFAQEAREKEEEAKVQLDLLEKESGKVKEGGVCAKCDEVKERIKVLKEERREAAVQAGNWTRKVREEAEKSKAATESIAEFKVKSTESRKLMLDKAKKILATVSIST